MNATDIKLLHERARETHELKQRIAALRHAALTLEQNLPVSKIQQKFIKAIINRLKTDANDLELTI